MPTLVFADVSRWQGSIDWATYGAHNPAVIINAAHGLTPDPNLATNQAGARAHCRAVGYYQRLTAGDDAAAQARLFCATVGALRPGEWLVLDLEDGTGNQNPRRDAWMAVVRAAYPAAAIWTYTYLNFEQNLPGVRIDWVAAYGSNEPSAPHSLWQSSDKTTFLGISAPCDANTFHGSIDDLLAITTKGTPMTEPAITLRAVHDSGPGNTPATRVVIHATCPNIGYPKASAPGTAHGTATYFTDPNSGGSAHYICDISGEQHCVPDDVVAWHAPPNTGSFGIEIDSEGGDYPLSYTRDQWLSAQVWPAVVRAASRTADLCHRYNIPVVRLSSADLLAGKHGICGHVDVSNAWHQSDHSDPGPGFPWAEFMAEVQKAYKGQTGQSAPVTQTAPPVQTSAQNPLNNALSDAAKKRLQLILGVTVDGQFGPASSSALEQHFHMTPDGTIDNPSTVVAKMQGYLSGIYAPGSTIPWKTGVLDWLTVAVIEDYLLRRNGGFTGA